MTLDGLGDVRLGEWHEWSGFAYRIRRRLNPVEQERIGPVVDIRHTAEARRRADALPSRLLALIAPEVLASEIK